MMKKSVGIFIHVVWPSVMMVFAIGEQILMFIPGAGYRLPKACLFLEKKPFIHMHNK